MERKQIAPSERRENHQTDPTAAITRGVLTIVEKHASQENLREWIPQAIDETETAIFTNLLTSVSAITKSDGNGVTFSNLTNLIGASADSCLTIGGMSEELHGYLANRIPELEELLRQHDFEGIDKIVSLFSISSTPRTDSFILNHFARAVVKSPKADEFNWIFDNLLIERRNDLVPSIVRGFSDLLIDWEQLDPEIEEKVLAWSNIPYEQSSDHWSFYIDHLQSAQNHVKSAVSLERKAHGTTRYLMDEFNIHCFSRYPEEALLDQYEARGEKSGKPYGLLLGTLHDWNNSTRNTKTDRMYGRFYKQVKESGYDMKVAEVATRDDLLYAAYKTMKDYGQMDFAVVHGHANQFLLALGERDNNVVVYNDFFSRASHIVTDAVKPGGTIVLAGCELGQIGGFAQKLSERGFIVFASNSISNLKGLTFFPEETPPIDATFIDSKELQIYRDGYIITNIGERVY